MARETDLDSFERFPTIEYEGVEIKCSPGDRLRDVLLAHDLTPHNGGASYVNCGGNSLCGTCAVELVGGGDRGATDEPGSRERTRLGAPPFGDGVPNRRLACRVEVTDDVRVRKHDGRFGQVPDEAALETPWHEQFLDGEPVPVPPEEYRLEEAGSQEGSESPDESQTGREDENESPNEGQDGDGNGADPDEDETGGRADPAEREDETDPAETESESADDTAEDGDDVAPDGGGALGVQTS